MNDINPLIHTQNDSNFDADHAIKFANLAVSFVAELAKMPMMSLCQIIMS